MYLVTRFRTIIWYMTLSIKVGYLSWLKGIDHASKTYVCFTIASVKKSVCLLTCLWVSQFSKKVNWKFYLSLMDGQILLIYLALDLGSFLCFARFFFLDGGNSLPIFYKLYIRKFLSTFLPSWICTCLGSFSSVVGSSHSKPPIISIVVSLGSLFHPSPHVPWGMLACFCCY